MTRPSVDVVLPFAGTDAQLAEVVARLATLDLRAGDTARVVDNRRGAIDRGETVLAAPGQQSSYYARNRGAEAGSAEWLLFLDADVRFDADLLDRLFDPLPADRTAVLAGAIEDEVIEDGPVAHWLRERGAMSQQVTLGGPRPYAQTAHCAIRRAAFTAVGGFAEGIRSGGDADLCFRLADAGWELEPRAATVRHEARARLRPLLAQMFRHGAGAAWVERRHPGSLPATPPIVGLAWWLIRSLPRAARSPDALLAPAATLAFALGRLSKRGQSPV